MMLCSHWSFSLITIISFLFYRVSADDGTPFLRFKKVETSTQRNGSISYFGTNKAIKVDGLFPRFTIQIIERLNNKPPNLVFYCHVHKLSRDSPITAARLCYQTSNSHKTICEDAYSSTFVLSGRYKFSVVGDIYTGYNFTSAWDRDKQALDATYFCELGNRNGAIRSNDIELQDIDAYRNELDSQRDIYQTSLDDIEGSSFPRLFECGISRFPIELPSWTQHFFRAPFEWVVCEGSHDSPMDLRNCYDKRRPIGDYFEHTILPNGTLVIHELSKPWQPLAIQCISSLTRNSIYSAYFGISSGRTVPLTYIPGSYPNHVVPKSPLNNRVNIVSGWHARNQISLDAWYTANPETVTAKWSKDGGSVPLHFTTTRHTLVFPQEIKTSYSGTYMLTLKDPYQKTEFKFDVVIDEPPQVKEAPPENIIVLQGHQVQLAVDFEGRLTSRAVLINGLPIETLSSYKRTESMRALSDSFPYMKDLNAEIEFPTDTSIRYTVRDLPFPPNSPYGASHIVTMIGTNALGSARVSSVVRVLPTPTVVRQLSDYSCVEECFNRTSHLFYCDIELSPYSGLRVSKTWELDDQDLERLDERDNRLAFLKHNEREVVLNIPKNNDTFDDLFASTELSCRFRVYSPEMKMFAGALYETPLYDTKKDENLHGLLTAQIRKDPSGARIVRVAGISWIVAVVIAIFILLIVAILAVCIVMRNKGKTYMLEREERLRGNDPEKEFRDRDAFQAYERSDEPPINGCNQSLDDTFQDVGSDDEGELDYYGMDPGNFNETGSFIGEYTRSSRRNDSRIGDVHTSGPRAV